MNINNGDGGGDQTSKQRSKSMFLTIDPKLLSVRRRLVGKVFNKQRKQQTKPTVIDTKFTSDDCHNVMPTTQVTIIKYARIPGVQSTQKCKSPF